jgi:hypothetical protein
MLIYTNGKVGKAATGPFQATDFDAILGFHIDVRPDTNMIVAERMDGKEVPIVGKGSEEEAVKFIDDLYRVGLSGNTPILDYREKPNPNQ